MGRARLTPAERERFLRAANDPSSALVQQLLASDELLEETQCEPWWETPTEPSEDEGERSSGSAPPVIPDSARRRRGGTPPVMPVPDALAKQMSTGNASASGPLLLYNICALW